MSGFYAKQNWFLWTPVAFGLGIAAYFSLTEEPPLIPTLAVGGLAILVSAWFIVIRGWGQTITLACCLAILGFTAAKIRTEVVRAPILEKRLGPVTVQGQISHIEPLSTGQRIVVKNVRISGLKPFRTPLAVRLKLQGEQPSLAAGDWIRVLAIVSPLQAPTDPGAFDFQRQGYFERLGGIGFSLGIAEIEDAAPDTGLKDLRTGINRLRQTTGDRVRDHVGGATGAVAAALMTGEKRAIPEETLMAMRDAGLAHLLAISGLHIGLVAGVIFFSVRFGLALVPAIALRWPIKKWAACAALIGAAFYCLMAGATVPTVRALIMAGLVLVAVMLDRRAITLRLVAWAAMVILVFQPEVLLTASFQMSFAAVTALVAAYEGLRAARADDIHGPKPWWQKPLIYIGGVALTTIIATAATGPLAAFHFNRFADYGLLANLIAVPITALWVMPAAVAAFAAMPFGLDGWILAFMGVGVDAVVATALWVAALPGAVQMVPAFPTLSLALMVTGGLVLCLVTGRLRFIGIPIFLLSFGVGFAETPADILVNDRGSLVAVRAPDGRLVFVSPKGRSFVKDAWLRRTGETEAHYIARGTGPKLISPPSDIVKNRETDISSQWLPCDALSCLLKRKGVVIALPHAIAALEEDCLYADVVISSEPVWGGCRSGTQVHDRFDFWRYGSHAFWINDDGTVTVKTVHKSRGNRPWVPKKSPKFSN